jgi:photosystem II stability/assembly factor-like uncharacterized protein
MAGTGGAPDNGGSDSGGTGEEPGAGKGGSSNNNSAGASGHPAGAAGSDNSAGGGNVIPTNPDGSWTNATGNLAGTPSACGTIPYVTVKPDTNMLIVGVVKQGVFSSTDSGKTWSMLGSGAGSATFGSGLSDVLFDPSADATWWLAGVRYGSPFRTDDDGETFQKLGDFPQNDGMAVDFSDPDRNTILVGGHEMAQEVEYSADGGATWKNIGVNLPADSGFSSYPWIVDKNTFMIGTSNSVTFRTTDKGAHWTKVVDGGGGAKPLQHSDGSLYWAAAQDGALVRSTDDGVTWKVVTPAGVVHGMKPIELPDGRIAMRSGKGMLVTDDGGANWKQVSPPVPNDYWWFVTTYNVKDKAFYTTRFACDANQATVNADALMRFGWDYTKD